MKKIVLLCAIVTLSWGYLFSQNMEQTKDYIVQLRNLPTSINNVITGIKSTNFGPFRISGSCGYNSQWYCFGNCNKWSWWWEFPNFQWLKGSLQQQYQNVSNIAGSFDAYFSPVKNWLVITLPQFTNTYKAQMDKILAAEAVFKDPSSTEYSRLMARQEIISSIQEINNGLQQGSDELKSGIQSLSNFNQQMKYALNGVQNLQQTMENSIAENQKQVFDKTATYPCDVDYARNQAINIQNLVRDQFNNVLLQASNFGVAAANIDNGTSIILGTLINIQNQYQGILQRLNNSQLTPEGAVQELHLNVTYLTWQDLVAFVSKEFN